MDSGGIIILVLIVLFVVWSRRPVKGVRQITTAELKGMLNDSDKQFIDVRTPGEYQGRRIRQFKNIPLNELSQKTEQLAKDREVVVICQSGMRSAKAAKLLKKAGFDKVSNVKGGMNTWV